jgi:hypothetical protein
MKKKLFHYLPILGLALAMGGALAAQVRMPTDDEAKRLFPKTGNPDGTLNCFPKCGTIGPCC